MIINPIALNSSPQDVGFEFQSTGQNIIEVSGCNNTDPELLIFTSDFAIVDVEFFRLCETDDDIQVVSVGGTVLNSTDVCIDGGVDLTIDEMLDNSFLVGDDELEEDEITGKFYVHAGPNLICETAAHPAGPSVCSQVFNTNPSINKANTVLNKVGIGLNDLGITTLNINYNVYTEDDILEKKELMHIHNFRHGDFFPPDDGITEVYLAPDLGAGSTGVGDAQGRANLANSLSIDVSDSDAYTFIHELGHAKWSLAHPGAPGDGEFMIHDDYNNFMGGVRNDILKFAVRRYQFHLMH